MNEAEDGAKPSRAVLQPFTFGGLAAFARARLIRLLWVELVFAILAGGCVIFMVQRAYAPVVLQCIQEMPAKARIADGRLAGIDTALVAENKFLAIAFTPEESAQIGQSSDVQIQFRPADFRAGTVFRPDWGWEFDYGADEGLDLSPPALEPWWGAWHPILLAAVGVATVVVLFCNWAALALIYTGPALFVAWFGDRQLSWFGAWRLSAAALMPGALLMDAAILLYAEQAVDLLGLAFLFVAHLLMGWIYLAGAAWACPRTKPDLLEQNPFTG